ncbi:hypothetical protein [Bradyrhizobium sp.]|uniref:hypothetical protein n=1 Tax=Bradyrhizobium sp. TaxID=376 RepID=UPI003C57FF03
MKPPVAGNGNIRSRKLFETATFMYYVPSIIVGMLRQIEFIDFALEAFPTIDVMCRAVNGGIEFSRIASPRQRAALVAPYHRRAVNSWVSQGRPGEYSIGHRMRTQPSSSAKAGDPSSRDRDVESESGRILHGLDRARVWRVERACPPVAALQLFDFTAPSLEDRVARSSRAMTAESLTSASDCWSERLNPSCFA